MVTIRGKESSTKYQKKFSETSVNNRPDWDHPIRCEACGEPRFTLRGSCEYCGYKESKHTSYNPVRYEKEIITLGVVFSEYRIKGKRRRKMHYELEAEADKLIAQWEKEEEQDGCSVNEEDMENA